MLWFSLLTVLVFSTFDIACPMACTPQLEGAFFPAPTCTNFTRCVNGTGWEMPCGPGTVWNQTLLTCVTTGGEHDYCTPEGPCPGPHPIKIWKPDCSGWYLCASNVISGSQSCPPGTIINKQLEVCVAPGSFWDSGDCEVEEPESGQVSCEGQPPGTLLPHPVKCQLYYNCSSAADDPALVQRPHLAECRYPNLYNPDRKQCEHHTHVVCGNREEVKYICDYQRYRCPVAHCRPCSADAPSCVGLPDGIQPHSSRPWSPFYAVCLDERTVFQESGGLHRCPNDWQGRSMIFHKELKLCLPLEDIPKEHGGL